MLRLSFSLGVLRESLGGDGFSVVFSDFSVTHLPDKVRTDWLDRNRAGSR